MIGMIGNRLAPPRFILFVLLLIAATAASVRPLGDWLPGIMAGFDFAAAGFLIVCLPLLRVRDTGTMVEHAGANDANRAMLLAITGVVLLVIMATIAAEIVGGEDT